MKQSLRNGKTLGTSGLYTRHLKKFPLNFLFQKAGKKPWGTAHATWMAEEVVKEPFATVNADDFYGVNSLKSAFDYLSIVDNSQHAACLIGYEVQNTLTDSGSVSRGVCEADDNGFLTEIIERTKISKNESGEIYFEEEGEHTFLNSKALVSMNLIGFSSKSF